jgi:GDSL-like Lipase/Acylhydrolase family
MLYLLDCIGDSITAGFGESTPYTTQLTLPNNSGWFYNNRGIPGQTLSTILSNTTSYYPVGQNYSVAVLWAGTNDISGGATAATVFANMQTMYSNLKSQGYTYVVTCTMLSRSGQDTGKNALNALILASPSTVGDAIASFVGTPLGVDGGSSNLTWFQADGIHPTQAGINTYEVPVIQAALNTLTYTTGSNPSWKTVQYGAYAKGEGGFWGNTNKQFTPSEPIGKGNVSIVQIWWDGATFNSISDTAGNTWTQAGTNTTVGSFTTAWFYTLGNVSDANTVITASMTGTPSFFGMSYMEHCPPSNTTSVHLNAGTYFTGTSSPNLTANAGDMLSVMVFSGNFGTAITAGSGYTARINNGLSTNSALNSEDQVASSSGSIDATLTYVGGTNASNQGYFFDFNATVIIPPTTPPTTGQPTPATAVNSSGHLLPITSPTTVVKQGQPIPIAFCDPNGNEYAMTGASVGGEVASPIPVVLCNSNGQPIVPPIVLSSNGNSLTVTATLTGNKLGQPTPVFLTDQSGNALSLSGFSYGSAVGAPTPIVLSDSNGNVISLSMAT